MSHRHYPGASGDIPEVGVSERLLVEILNLLWYGRLTASFVCQAVLLNVHAYEIEEGEAFIVMDLDTLFDILHSVEAREKTPVIAMAEVFISDAVETLELRDLPLMGDDDDYVTP